jgi:hypothetical protein
LVSVVSAIRHLGLICLIQTNGIAAQALGAGDVHHGAAAGFLHERNGVARRPVRLMWRTWLDLHKGAVPVEP